MEMARLSALAIFFVGCVEDYLSRVPTSYFRCTRQFSPNIRPINKRQAVTWAAVDVAEQPPMRRWSAVNGDNTTEAYTNSLDLALTGRAPISWRAGIGVTPETAPSCTKTPRN